MSLGSYDVLIAMLGDKREGVDGVKKCMLEFYLKIDNKISEECSSEKMMLRKKIMVYDEIGLGKVQKKI